MEQLDIFLEDDDNDPPKAEIVRKPFVQPEVKNDKPKTKLHEYLDSCLLYTSRCV